MFKINRRWCLLFISALILPIVAVAQTPIDDIQFYVPVTGDPDSPFFGETVTVTGVVTAAPGVYEDEFLGIYLQDDTGGLMVTLPDPYDAKVGEYMAFVGVVDHNAGASSEVRLNTLHWMPMGAAVAPAPAVLTLTQALTDGENIGSLVRVSGHVAAVDTSSFTITDGVDSLRVHVLPNTGISLAEVALADTFTVVGPLGRSDGAVRILPRDQHDLAEGSSYNDIRVASFSCSNWAPDVGESWTMSFVVEASTPPEQLVFRYRYVEAGPEWTTLTWRPPTGMKGIYPTEFTGASYGTPSEVEWDFDDGSTNTTTMTPCIGTMALGTWYNTDILNDDICNPDLGSPMNGKPVNLECVVVAAEPMRAVLMDVGSMPAKGIYPTEFTGASYGTPCEEEWDFDDGATNTTTMTPCQPREKRRYGVRVWEHGGMTMLIPCTFNSAYLVSSGNDLPVPDSVPTGILADNVNDGDCAQGMAFENVRVQPLDAVVVDVSEFATSGTYRVSSTGSLDDALTVRHSAPLAYAPAVGEIVDAVGYMDRRDDEYQLVIGSDNDIAVLGVSYGGVSHTPTGDAEVIFADGPPDTVVVTNMGFTEDDGVSLGIADYIPVGSVFTVDLEFDADPGNYLEARTYGLVGGLDELLATSRIEVLSDTTRVRSLDLSPSAPASVKAVVMQDGETVRVISGLPSVFDMEFKVPAGNEICAANIGNDHGGLGTGHPEHEESYWMDDDWVWYLNCIGSGGDTLFTLGQGDYSFDFMTEGGMEFEDLTRVDILGNVPEFRIVDEGMIPAPQPAIDFDGYTHTSGQLSSLSLVDDTLVWEKLGAPGLGGFTIDIAGKVMPDSIFTVETAFDATPGQYISNQVTGLVLGSEVTVASCGFHVDSDTTHTLSLDMSQLGSQFIEAVIMEDGVVTQVVPDLPSQFNIEVRHASVSLFTPVFGYDLDGGRTYYEDPWGPYPNPMITEAHFVTTGGDTLFSLGAGHYSFDFGTMDQMLPVDDLTSVSFGFSPDLPRLTILNEAMISVPAVTAVGQPQGMLPTVASILSVYPNPFNPQTEISFGLPSEQKVSLAVYDLVGREVRKLFGGVLPGGVHRISWDGRSDSGARLASAPYLLCIKTEDSVLTRKLLLLK